MIVNYMLRGLTELLSEIYGEAMRPSKLLAHVGAGEQSIQKIAVHHRVECLTAIVSAVRSYVLSSSLHGEQLWSILASEYGLDGEPPTPAVAVADDLGLSETRYLELHCLAHELCRQREAQWSIERRLTTFLSDVSAASSKPKPSGDGRHLGSVTQRAGCGRATLSVQVLHRARQERTSHDYIAYRGRRRGYATGLDSGASGGVRTDSP